jgi:hypothetical protein
MATRTIEQRKQSLLDQLENRHLTETDIERIKQKLEVLDDQEA